MSPWDEGGEGRGREASLMHPTASIGPHEISGSRDWTGAVILLGTSCFNIQIVICHPTGPHHAGIVSPPAPVYSTVLSQSHSQHSVELQPVLVVIILS